MPPLLAFPRGKRSCIARQLFRLRGPFFFAGDPKQIAAHIARKIVATLSTRSEIIFLNLSSILLFPAGINRWYFFSPEKEEMSFSTGIVRRTHCWNGTFSKNSKGESRLRKKLVSNYDVTKKPCLVNHRFAIDSLPSKSVSGERNIGGKNVDEELVAPSRSYQFD